MKARRSASLCKERAPRHGRPSTRAKGAWKCPAWTREYTECGGYCYRIYAAHPVLRVRLEVVELPANASRYVIRAALLAARCRLRGDLDQSHALTSDAALTMHEQHPSAQRLLL